MPYIDVRDPNMVDLYDVDPDLSTPDHTTNSEPDALMCHLAEQERAFSEDNVHDHTPDSQGGRVVAPTAAISIDIHSENGEYNLREAIVYREAAVDNSCVVNVGDGDGGEYSGVRHHGDTTEDDDDDEGEDYAEEEDEESFKECYPNMSNTLQWYIGSAPWWGHGCGTPKVRGGALQ